MFTLRKGLFLIFTTFIFISNAKANEHAPLQLDDGWSVTSPTLAEMDAGFVSELRKKSKNGTYEELVSVVVTRNGKLIIEEYFNGNNKDTKHDVRSVGKSFTSTLFGLTLDKGMLESEEQAVLPFIKNYLVSSPDENLGKLKLKHLLSMNSGFNANEDDPTTPGYEEKMYETEDWVKFAVNTPFVSEPGKTWAYASLNPTILGFVLENAAKMPLADFADENLFAPLQITDYLWEKSPKGRIIAAGNLKIKARDMAKLGQLYLDKGKWNGKQVLSEEWVNKVTSRFLDTGYGKNSFLEKYSYFWWSHSFVIGNEIYPVYFASGNGGQKIYVVPDKKLVVAIQTTAYGQGWAQRQSAIMLMSVIAATKSNPET